MAGAEACLQTVVGVTLCRRTFGGRWRGRQSLLPGWRLQATESTTGRQIDHRIGTRADGGRSSRKLATRSSTPGPPVARKRRYRSGNGEHRSRRSPETSLPQRKREAPVAAWPGNVAIAAETANTPGRGVARKCRHSNRFGKHLASAHRHRRRTPGVDRPTSTA